MSSSPPLRLCVWSGPASLSTVLMYSFGNREDTTAIDEPFYAHYLSHSPPEVVARHPGVDEVLGAQHKEAKDVVEKTIFSNEYKSNIVYFKMMSHHITPQVDKNFLANTTNVILIREPKKIVASFVKRMNSNGTDPTLKDVGLQDLYHLQQTLRNEFNQDPIVIDADDLQDDPVSILSQLCSRLGIPFDESRMLKWEAGPKSFDGIWAKHWYSDVHASVGWNTRVESKDTQPKELSEKGKTLVTECTPFYKKLHGSFNRIRPLPPLPDPRNKDIWVWVGSGLVKRDDAKVSVLDSIVQGGDGVWEGLRVYNGKIFCLDEHLDRLYDSTKAMGFTEVPPRDEIKYAIFATFRANKMFHNAHARMTLTRGKKVTSSMDPKKNQYGPTLIVLAEFKPPIYSTAGITLITSSIRRNTPSCLDSKIHHNNLCNNILAKIQANNAGADDAVMLDVNGFISETNATNMFIVKRGTLLTPHADSCLHGITRAKVLQLARKTLALPVEERNISLAELYSCDECFTTGTMGEITPVLSVDGRHIGDSIGEITQKILTKFMEATESEGEKIPGM